MKFRDGLSICSNGVINTIAGREVNAGESYQLAGRRNARGGNNNDGGCAIS
jgi:hypothetical protein